MISQGNLFPFKDLKEKETHIDVYPEIHNAMKTDDGYGKWENERKKKEKKVSENVGVNYEFMDDMIPTTEVENFKDATRGNILGGEEDNMEKRRESKHVVWKDEVLFQKEKEEKNEHIIPFWVEDPNILFQSGYINEFFPIGTMSYNQKLNSISRLVILLTLAGFLFVRNMRILWIGGVCLLAIFLLHYTHNKNESNKRMAEGFDDHLESLGVDAPAQAVINAFATDDPSKIGKREFFDTPKVNNPYNNVLITDIVDNPKKLPALPAYYPETEKEILEKTKEAIQKMNPTFPNMTDKLFASLDDHFEFEQSARQFYSNPSTTIPNDQGAFAEFCYGEMISCKEGNMFACARDAPRHNLY